MKCEKLDVWKKSARLSADVYKAFKSCKDFGFKDQITRAGLSIPSNIAEGMEKSSLKEQVRFLDIAKGSAAELRTQVYIANQVGIIPNNTQKELTDELKSISAMLQGLASSLKT